MLTLYPARALVSGPIAVSLPWVAYDLVAKSGWGLVAPFAFVIALGATLAFGAPWYFATRSNKFLSSPVSYLLAGVALGVVAVMAGIMAFDADLLADALKSPPDGGWGPYPLIASALGGVSALVSRLAGAKWKVE